MKKITKTLLGLMLTCLCMNSLRGDEVWQTKMEADTRLSRRVGGMAMSLQDDQGNPTLLMNGGLTPGLSYIGPYSQCMGPFPFMFGYVSNGDSLSFQSQDFSNVGNTVRYGNGGGSDLFITINRLSPGVLIETSSSTLQLFKENSSSCNYTALNGVEYHVGQQTHNYSASWTNKAAEWAIPGGKAKPLRWATKNGGNVQVGVLGTQSVGDLPKNPNADVPYSRAASEAGVPVNPSLNEMNQNWLLLWYGHDSSWIHSKTPATQLRNVYNLGLDHIPFAPEWPVTKTCFQVDIPLLVIFQNNPNSISFSETNGIQFGFPSQAGKVVIVPLLGTKYLRATETEHWLSTGLPQDIIDQCDLMAQVLGQFPTSVNEAVNYNKAEDKVEFTETFTFSEVCSGAQEYSPLPAMLALAKKQGMNVGFSGSVVDTELTSLFGPASFISGTSFTWSVEGLNLYITDMDPQLDASNSASADVKQRLESEVDKIIAAGHLDPGIFPSMGANASWANPADTLWLLAEVLPVLSPAKQEALKAYMTSERNNYPPESVVRLAADDPNGARREAGDISHEADSNNMIPGKTEYGADSMPEWPDHDSFSIYRAYGLARYYQATGEVPSGTLLSGWGATSLNRSLEDHDWASFGWFAGKYAVEHKWFREFYTQFSSRAVNRDLAGVIGLLRMYHLNGSDAPNEAWGQYAKLAALRFAMARYGSYLAKTGIVGTVENENAQVAAKIADYADYSVPENFGFVQVLEMNQYNITLSAGAGMAGAMRGDPFIAYADMVPEVGRILKDWGAGADTQAALDYLKIRHPNWYAAKADANDGNEYAFMYKQDSHQLFNAHAWIVGTSAEDLEFYSDISWMAVGDLFYMHKLAETAKKYRNIEWTGNNIPPQVVAGADQEIMITNQASLDATVSDDGNPEPASLTYQWTQVSGPGTANFATPNAEDTTLSFNAVGQYILRLTVSDGQKSGYDEVTFTVTQPVPGIKVGTGLAIGTYGSLDITAMANEAVSEARAAYGSGTPKVILFVHDFGDTSNIIRNEIIAEFGGSVLIAGCQTDGKYAPFTMENYTDWQNAERSVSIMVLGGSDIVEVESQHVFGFAEDWASSGPNSPAEREACGQDLGDNFTINPSLKNLIISFGSQHGTSVYDTVPGIIKGLTGGASTLPSYIRLIGMGSNSANDGKIYSNGTVYTGQQNTPTGTPIAAIRIAGNFNWAFSGQTQTGNPFGSGSTTGWERANTEIPANLDAIEAELGGSPEITICAPAHPDEGGHTAAQINSYFKAGLGENANLFGWVGASETGHDSTSSNSIGEIFHFYAVGLKAVTQPDNYAPEVIINTEDQQIEYFGDDINVSLDATVTDDNKPAPYTLQWMKVSGPATYTIANPNNEDTTVTFTGIGTYVFKLTADDTQYVGADSITIQIFEQDHTAPSIPQNLTATAFNASKIDLSWDAATDNIAVDHYEIFRNGGGTAVGTVAAPGTTFQDSGLMPETGYSYTVQAVDTSGNASDHSQSAQTTTEQSGVLAGLVGHWKFDESSGSAAADNTANANNCTLNGAVFQPIGGKFNGAVEFDGVSNEASIPHNAVFNFGAGEFSVAFWMKKNAGGASDARIVKKLGSKGSFTFHLNGNDLTFFRYDGSQVYSVTSSGVNVVDGNWHHVVGLKRGTNLYLYIDGISQGSVQDAAEGDLDSTADISLGRQGGGYYSGLIDDLCIYSKALEDVDITELIQNGIPEVGNQAPIVNAGADQNITLPTDTVNLDGTVNDDGLPEGAAVTTTWTKVSGAGTVTFGNANAVDTSAQFSAAGTYVLRLSTDDTDKQSSDEVTVTVTDAAPANDGRIYVDENFHSAARGVDISLYIYLPPGYDEAGSTEKYPVLYLMHGIGGYPSIVRHALLNLPVTGDTSTSDGSNQRAASKLDELINAGELPKFIIVSPEDGHLEDGQDGWNETMITEELVTFIETNYRAKSELNQRSIEGFSMGASAAEKFAAKHPDKYISMICYSLGDSSAEWVTNKAQILANGMAVRLAGGEDDSWTYDRTEPFHNYLTANGIPHEFETLPGVSHDLGEIYAATGIHGLKFHAAKWLGQSNDMTGQIIVDPNNPTRMIYKDVEVDGRPKAVTFVGPGDPEDMFYNGKQTDVDFLIAKGARSTYVTAVLQDFGGGDPGTGAALDAKLDEWENYITQMENAGIITVFFFFDDSQALTSNWQELVDKAVAKFKHHKLFIWSVAEEYGEALSQAEVSQVAARIKQQDDNNHVVAVHQNNSNTFDFASDANIDMFAMQLNNLTVNQLHDNVKDSNVAGTKILNMAEAQDHAKQDRATVRQWNWAAVMGGASGVQVVWMGRASDDPAWNEQEKYDDCKNLMDFMELTDVNNMSNNDALAHDGTLWVLADTDNDSYIAYARALAGGMGVKGLGAGTYTLKWIDCAAGTIVDQTDVAVAGGDTSFSKPGAIGNELAVWIRKTGAAPSNQAPSVDAGANQTIALPINTVNLDGTVTDDNLPNPPAALTTTWSKVSGPGTVTFGDANAVDTTAQFSVEGTYVLQLLADDSALQNTDTVTVTVNPEAGNGEIPAGYIGYWKFDDNTNDESANANNVQLNGAIYDAAGHNGSALSFNGTSDSATIPHLNAYNFGGNGDFTIGFWMKKNSGGSDNARLIQKLAANGPYVVHLNGGSVRFFRYDGVNLDGPYGSSNVTDGGWHHVSAVKEGSNLRIYVDGNLEDTVTDPTSSVENTGNITLGKQSSLYFSGLMDELAMYDRALTALEVSALMNGNGGGTPTEYTLTVNSGSGDGDYEEDSVVNISADAAPAGQEFDAWTGDIANLADANSATTTVTMPAADVTVTATFKDLPPVTYTLTVNYGAGDGDYEEATAVNISADAPAAGYAFVNWTSANGGSFADANSAATVYTMPGNDAAVTANYAINTYTLSYTAGVNGNILGTTPQTVEHGANGSSVTAVANAGYHFVNWNDGVTTASRTDTNVTANISVTAIFEEDVQTNELLAHWKFDETNGTIAVDETGNAYDGILNGGTTWVDGKVGSGALEFDGSSAYMTTGLDQDLNAWTIACWVKSPNAPAASAASGPMNREKNFQINWNHPSSSYRGAAALEVGGTWYSASFGTLEANTWHHLAASYDGETLKAYRDGVLVTENDTMSGAPDSETAELTLGKHPFAEQYFNGSVDDARVYNYPLTDVDIALLADNSNQLRAHWQFEEGAGTTAADSSGNGYNATLNGNASWVNGQTGNNAVFMDGINGYASTNMTENLENWSVSCWVKSPFAPQASLASGPINREKNFQINWNHPSSSYRGAAALEVGGTWYAASFGTLEANTWYHLVATYDGDKLRTYKDGVLVTENDAMSGAPSAEAVPMSIGKHPLAEQYFEGTVDDIRVYNYPISENAVIDLFEMSIGLDY